MTKWVKKLPEMENDVVDVISDIGNTQVLINWNNAAKTLTKEELQILHVIVGKLQDANKNI